MKASGKLFSLFPGKTGFFLLILVLSLQAKAQPAQHCGTADSTLIPMLERYFGNPARMTSARTSIGEPLVYRLAIDINYKTYLLYRRDKIRISEVVHEFIEKASQLFEKEINIRLVVSDLLIWDTPEPYQLISDFDYYVNIVDYWTNHRPGDRDCVVSLSARVGTFYGGGRMCTADLPAPYNTHADINLLCHELGHTLGSPHTHSCFWPGGPIDVCSEAEAQSADCQAPFTDFVNGTIMSYCRSVMEFHPYCRNLMRDYAEGKVQEVYFALGGISPAGSVSLTLNSLYLPEFSPAPAFSWRSTNRTDTFRFQVSYDAGFTRLAEDTVTRQPFYHSTHFAGGTYFARVRAESGGEPGPWSAPVIFEMPGFDAHRTPPAMIYPAVSGHGLVTTSFRNEPHADAYQVQVLNAYTGAVIQSEEGETSPGPIQEISFPSLYQDNQIRLRVRYGSEWSNWSAFPQNLSRQPANLLHPSTPLVHTSANPLLSRREIRGQAVSPRVTHYMEISPDAGFTTITTRDSVKSNEINQYSGNKIRFSPKLDEKERYFVRVRTGYEQQNYSEWVSYTLETGRHDKRFTYLGSLPKFSNAFDSFSQMSPQSRLLKSGDRLYVYGNWNYLAGYYVTSDLQNWQEITGRTTKGKVPSLFYAFGATPAGEAWMLHQPGNITISKTDGTFEYSRMSQDLSLYDTNPAYMTRNQGLFFIMTNRGIARVLDGNLNIFRQETFPSYIPVTLAAGHDDSIWALMEGGSVYVFREGSWNLQSQFPYWNMVRAFCFAPDGTPWLYGNFGAARFNGQAWENVPAVKGYLIRKAVFDNRGQLWMASYQNNGPQTYETYALLKLKGETLTSYTDGLNFLREPFDLEFFNGNLVIMTTGGEIHTFDETQIQRFTPSPAYCHGGEIVVTVTSNSSFGSDNLFTLELVNRETGESERIAPSVEEGDLLRATLPGTLPEGTYTLRTVATSPELTSNESPPFTVYANKKPVITTEAAGLVRQRISTLAQTGYSYQWLLDDQPVSGGTGPELEAVSSGTYALVATNPAGCPARSDAITISIPDPGELTLLQNAPNPFTEATSIAFYLPAPQHASLGLFDQNGRRVAVLKEEDLPAGWHEIPLEGSTLSAGIYLYRLTTPSGERVLKTVKQ